VISAVTGAEAGRYQENLPESILMPPTTFSYTEVAGELAEAAAVAIAAFVPRRANSVPNGGGNDH
jgi:hypothetical protein